MVYFIKTIFWDIIFLRRKFLFLLKDLSKTKSNIYFERTYKVCSILMKCFVCLFTCLPFSFPLAVSQKRENETTGDFLEEGIRGPQVENRRKDACVKPAIKILCPQKTHPWLLLPCSHGSAPAFSAYTHEFLQWICTSTDRRKESLTWKNFKYNQCGPEIDSCRERQGKTL